MSFSCNFFQFEESSGAMVGDRRVSCLGGFGDGGDEVLSEDRQVRVSLSMRGSLVVCPIENWRPRLWEKSNWC